MSNLQLITSRQFNGITLNCYRTDEQQDPQDFWATRTDIGQALGYKNPRKAIGDLHSLHKDRLDKFSCVRKTLTHEENRDVTREVIVYNFKGLLEICRYSNQPNAHKVIDVLWDIADEIRRTGSYGMKQLTHKQRMAEFDCAMKQGKKLYMSMGYRGVKLAVALDKIYKDYLGFSALEIAGIDPKEAVYEATPQWIRRILDYMKEHETVTPSELSRSLGISFSAAKVQLGRMVQQGYLYRPCHGVYALDETYKD